MKKRFLLILGIILLLPKVIFANEIKNISMNIYVDNNGDAHIEEKWIAKLDNGTEGYKPYYNLGESTISNFKVSMNGNNFTYLDNWNINGSFNDKKYKNGFNYLDDGIELCFGISEYGNNTYTLNYDISNFVVNTSDGYQMIYWTLFPYDYDPSPERVYIKIYSDFKYADDLDVWGYGKGGVPTYVYDGYIEMDSESTVYSDEYMTILVKFPSDTFNTSVSMDKTFDKYLEMANEGAINYTGNKNKTSIFEALLGIFSTLFPFLIFLIPVIVLSTKPKYGTYKINFGKIGNKVSKAPYFRDLPYKMDNLSRGYWIACQYNLVSKNTDYLGALLLKWLKLGNISIQKNNDKKKDSSSIILNNCANLNEDEVELYNMMYTASEDGILEKNEFTSWCKSNYSKILNWFNKVIDKETLALNNEELLKREGNTRKYLATDKLYEEANKVSGLKNFLKDFSNIKDRSAIEVNLWEEYLMYAQIFGIAKKVMKEFKDLYPDIITEEVYNDFDFIYFISYNGISSATTARDRANSYSSGGGGFSSSGGGGGSFGGGGGGGGFR